jgi:hypothetical protein
MAFTIAKLTEALSITPEQADQVIGLVRGRIDPFSVPAVEEWRRQCYHEPDASKPETIMRAIDAVLETCGTEAIWGTSCTVPAAEYCNAGDTYAPTILYDYVASKYRLISWGDFVERFERRYDIR